MQIFWVSSSVGQIRRINLTLKTLAIGALLFSALLIIFGVALEIAGFRMAVEYDPQIARKLGNFHTADEIENLNLIYQSRLAEVHAQLDTNTQLITELEASNKKLMVIATPPAILKAAVPQVSVGGPYIPIKNTGLEKAGLLQSLAQSSSEIRNQNELLTKAIKGVNAYIVWLRFKPTAIPLKDRVDISSAFGKRMDPLKGVLSEHQGLDFQAPNGTMIHASAAGIVEKAGWDSEYGKFILINHGDGYVTRYAHASELLVVEGAKVDRLDPVAKVGNSGRATGPHLHFEILQNGKQVNPKDWLIGLRPEWRGS